jgi:hypothetical protein
MEWLAGNWPWLVFALGLLAVFAFRRRSCGLGRSGKKYLKSATGDHPDSRRDINPAPALMTGVKEVTGPPRGANPETPAAGHDHPAAGPDRAGSHRHRHNGC